MTGTAIQAKNTVYVCVQNKLCESFSYVMFDIPAVCIQHQHHWFPMSHHKLYPKCH